MGTQIKEDDISNQVLESLIFGYMLDLFDLYWVILQAGRLQFYSNITNFYAKLLEIWSHKFNHATENEILCKSIGGAISQITFTSYRGQISPKNEKKIEHVYPHVRH